MKTKFLIGLLMGIVLITGCVQQPLTQECDYSGYGDWQIMGEVDCSNKEIILNGNLIVSGFGSLLFNNITLIMNSQRDGQYRIDVLDGGNFEIVGSKITASNPNYGYQFYYRKGSSGFIDTSVIEETSPGEDVLNTGGHGAVGGLNVFTDGFVLKNSIVRNSKGRGALFGAAKNISVLNNTFYGNYYDGVRFYECSDVIAADNTGYDNGEYAIKAIYSKDVIIRDNVARNNKGDGIHLHTCENVLIEGNNAFENGGAGIKAGPGGEEGGSSRIFVRNNIARKNGDPGILFLTTSDSEISGNIVEESGNNGIVVQWSSHNTRVLKNTVTGSNYSGIVVFDSDNVIVSNNEISNNGDTGIVFEYSENSESSNNIIKNHGFNGPMAGIFLRNSTVVSNNDYIENSTAIGIDMRSSEVTITDAIIKESHGYDVQARENSSALVTNCDCEKFNQDDTSRIIKETPEADLVMRVGGNSSYFSIQEAIDSSRDGSTIQVSQGIYSETVSITASKTLTLQGGWNQEFTSRSKNSALTVIDAGWNGNVIDIHAGPGATITLIIDGFTIQNGEGEEFGGGIFIQSEGSVNVTLVNNTVSGSTVEFKGGGGISMQSVGGSIDATLVNNTVSGNNAHNGGGISIEPLDGPINVTIVNNTISENTANNEGAGIRVESSSTGSAEVTLIGNLITNNNVTHLVEEQGGWDGGGVAAFASGSGANTTLRLINNIITGNEAGWGGGVFGYAYGPDEAVVTMVLTNNIIAGNKAGHGGAIFACSGITGPDGEAGGSVIWILNSNTITGNTASDANGGIHIHSGSTYGDGGSITLSMKNDILWGNTAPHGKQQLVVGVEEGRAGVATATVSYSDVGMIEKYHGGTYTVNHVINEDPLFIDSSDQVFLLWDTSPCVDAGDPDPVYNDGCSPPARRTERNDMGAYGGPNNCHFGGKE